jgi:uncharacterized protein (TIGR00299 family) protein
MIAYLDCATGVSGDKLLAAFVDAGVDGDAVAERVASLGLDASLTFEKVSRGGVAGTSAMVRFPAEQPPRTWRDIRALLREAPLAEGPRRVALEAFGLLAEAEAQVHDTPVEDVHFHELGAVDTIVDIVGVAVAFGMLGVRELVCSPVALGAGTVETAHGTLPVPAPATARLLAGVPSVAGPPEGELTTPTGAALVRVLATGFGPMPAMTPRSVGFGAGTRELSVPNLLRLFLGEISETPGTDRVAVLETAVDHLTAEELAYVCDSLADRGAIDVWRTPIVMKKGRAAVEITVLAAEQDADPLAALVMELTGTLGVRTRIAQRRVAEREARTVDTSLGPVRVKVAHIAGTTRIRPEHDDCALIAERTGMPIDRVRAVVTGEAERIIGEEESGL